MNQKENLRLAKKHFGGVLKDWLPQYREFVIRSFSIAPEWFWHVPAAMGGRHHPRRARSLGGLVEHTKLAVLWAELLFVRDDVRNTDTRSEVLAALLLHDLFKFEGQNGQRENYVKRHGIWASVALSEYWAGRDRPTGLSSDSITRIIQAVACHMGRWGDMDTPEDSPPKNAEVIRLVQEADYAAAKDIDAAYAATFGVRQL